MRALGFHCLTFCLLVAPAAYADDFCAQTQRIIGQFSNGLSSPDIRGAAWEAEADDDAKYFDGLVKLYGDRCSVAVRPDGHSYTCRKRVATDAEREALANQLAACPLRFRGNRRDSESTSSLREKASEFEVIAPGKIISVSITTTTFRTSGRSQVAIRFHD